MPSRTVQAILLAALVLAPPLAVESATAHSGPHDGKSGQTRTFQESLTQYRFSPDTIKDLHAKDRVVFKNRDPVAHRLKGDGLDSGDIAPEGTWSWTPLKTGDVTFVCAYHPRMKLALKVLEERPPNHAPVVKILEPTDGQSVSGVITVKIDAKDEDANLATVRVRLAGGDWVRAEPPNPWVVRIDTTRYKDGEYPLEAAGVDGDGEYSPIDVVRLVIANDEARRAREQGSSPTSPDGAVTISAPIAGSTIRGSFFVQGTSKPFNGSQAAKARVRVDGGEWREAEGSSAWRYNLDTTKLTDGMHTIEATAWDGKQTSSIASVRVFVANHDPSRLTIRILTPGERTTVAGKVGIQGDLGGPNLDAARVLVRVDGGPWTAADGVNPWSARWDATAAPSGSHTIEAMATTGKIASNVARVIVTVAPRNAPVDATPPQTSSASTLEKPIPAAGAAVAAFTLAALALATAGARRRP